MTWISFVCLLALTSSAFANYGQPAGYGATLPKMASILNVMRDQSIRRPVLPVVPKVLEQPSYGQLDEIKLPTDYSSSVLKTLPVQGYGAAPRMISFDQPKEIQQVAIVTEADNFCRGQAPETVIPLDNGRRFIVCLDDGKGTEQFCPKGLFYHPTSRRCERKYGPQDYCASQPCLNGGQCMPTETHYQCQCAAGFEGLNCELDARICQTQYPCGQSPDARCQSFRLGAALSYVCILQDGLAYGLSASQAVASPCQGIDGPQALGVSNKGFIMCDGERMFVESCPGGTIWDDVTKACVWPDVEPAVPQNDQSSYSYGSYGQARELIKKPTYGGALLEQPKLVHGHHMHHHKLIQKPIQRYGSHMNIRPVLEQPKLTGGYGAEIVRPVLEQPKLVGGYGAKIERPVFEQPKLTGGYGAEMERPVFEQPKLTGGYGAEIERPVFEQPKLVGGYGAKIERPIFEQPKLTGGYGAEIERPIFEQPKLVGGYGAKIERPIFEQPKLIKPSAY